MQPKVFISYSWSSPAHEGWVINLAERLTSDGIHVTIDKWDLKEGHDSYSFMESMVQSPAIDKVLIILDEKYTQKANNRNGGVGTETQIISPQVYGHVIQDKFIPIVTQYDDKGKAFVPTYLAGRIYIDLSRPDHFESEYEKLLRSIFQRPALSRPKLGTPPSYLFEDTPITFKTTFILRSIDTVLINSPVRLNATISDFLDEFSKNLSDFNVTFTERTDITIGKEIVNTIHQYTPLRDDFVHFFDKVIRSGIGFDVDLLIRFYEKVHSFTQPDVRTSSYFDYQFDSFRFMIHELFLYMIMLSIKSERYDLMEQILLSRYFVEERYNSYNNNGSDFHAFYNHVQSFDTYYKDVLSSDFYSPMADLMIKRIPVGFTKDLLVHADIICHHVGAWNDIEWFPVTYIYRPRGAIDFFRRMISQRHFDKVKALFGVKTATEFIERLNEAKAKMLVNNGLRYSGASDSVAPIYQLINIETVASSR